MLMSDSHAAGRRTLAFSLVGLESREQMLFKSFVRLIDHLTHQHWVPADHVADLVVAGADAAVPEQVPVLKLGTTARNAPHYLTLPLHADQLEQELNLLGDLIALSQPTPAAVATTVRATFTDAQPLRLVRWPPPALLRGTERLRLATMMSVRTFTPSGLREQSGSTASAIADFLSDLSAAELLEVKETILQRQPTGHLQTASQQTTSLFARIRTRLGLPARGQP